MSSTNRWKSGLDAILRPKIHSYYRKRLLEKANGVLHIGAHFGQEAGEYASKNKKVIWIEAHPEYFERLRTTIEKYPNQVAINALVGVESSKTTKFFIASNEGASSSIFDLSLEHGFENIGLKMTNHVELEMKRLEDVVSPDMVNQLTHWVVDVQGAELAVLKGAGELINVAKSMEVEVSTREVYQGGVLFNELKAFLFSQGFEPVHHPPQNWHGDILFIRA